MSNPGESTRAYFEIQIEKVERQIRLLGSVAWWYLAPFYVGACLVVLGSTSIENALSFSATYALICAGIYWLNQRAVKSYLVPIRDDLQAVLSELADES